MNVGKRMRKEEGEKRMRKRLRKEEAEEETEKGGM